MRSIVNFFDSQITYYAKKLLCHILKIFAHKTSAIVIKFFYFLEKLFTLLLFTILIFEFSGRVFTSQLFDHLFVKQLTNENNGKT